MRVLVKSLRNELVCRYDSYTEESEEMNVYVLNCTSGTKKYELSLWTEYGECPSGYCRASYGHGTISEVKEFLGTTHTLDSRVELDLVINEEKSEDGIFVLSDQNNELFSLENYGYDIYYPSGGVLISMERFKETARTKNHRPVWIFMGDSGAGKSYLSSIIANMENKSVYETDSQDTLPSSLREDIIVIGNRFYYTVEEIEERIVGEHETILVNFSR